MPELKIKFDRHGLGDCVHFAHALQLYKRRGYDVTAQVEENKLFVWKVAGVNIVQGGGLPDHPYIYPARFDDLKAPDHETNKVAFGLRHETMPRIELPSEHVWDELADVRLSAHDFIPPEAHTEAERFLEGMPRPIICLHSRGTNWHERKSIPTEVAFDLILKLLAQTSGSVIVLDYDERAPMVGSARCKGIRPSWGQISVDRLCALFERSDLVIGVDSGPFHAATFTDIKALGVFRALHPNRVCLPNPNAVYLASDQHAQQWDLRRDKWNIMTYHGAEPSADDITWNAIRLLDGKGVLMHSKDWARWYEYNRVGYDSRPIELVADGTIAGGRGDAEQRWFVTDADAGPEIAIAGHKGIICRCVRGADGVFRGHWNQFEKMPIELTPRVMPGDPPDISNGQLQEWSAEHARSVFPTYEPDWTLPVGSRGNGMIWLLDPSIARSDLDSCGIDHEDWMYQYMQLPDGAVVLDLASFVGTHAVWMAKRGARVYAVEPMPQTRRLLEMNIALNGVERAITVIPKAFGRVTGTTKMSYRSAGSVVTDDGDIDVQITTVDLELQDVPRLDLVKLDVEGHECEVIEGARATLARLRPRLIVEVHSHMPGNEANGTVLADQLHSLGYSFRRIWTNTEAYYYIEAVPAHPQS